VNLGLARFPFSVVSFKSEKLMLTGLPSAPSLLSFLTPELYFLSIPELSAMLMFKPSGALFILKKS